MTAAPTVLIVPGLRDSVAEHWQTLLEARLRAASRPVAAVPPMGRADLGLAPRLEALERIALGVDGALVIVAHSGGCVTVAHWALKTRRAVQGALLAVPPDFERPMPAGYPALAELLAAGWLPVPRLPLPFRAIVGASRDDPLADFDRIAALAQDWRAECVDLGFVGHLNPAAGYGIWSRAEQFVAELSAGR
jgi:predicted alpha/beta hydrolase family esterase